MLTYADLCRYLSTRYNRAFRSLFLYTINPNGAFNKFAAWNVVFWTKVFVYVCVCACVRARVC